MKIAITALGTSIGGGTGIAALAAAMIGLGA